MTKCSHCGKAAAFCFQSKDRNRKISDEAFNYYKCNTCGLIYLDPLPTDLGRFYPPQYYEIPTSVDELARLAERLQSAKMATLQRFVSGGRLLEIGPAYGLFAFLAKRAGFEVTGIEMDARCCDFLRAVVQIQVLEGNDSAGLLRQVRNVDAVVLWQVVEHLPDPWAVLKAAAQQLNVGGILIVDTPNPAAFQYRLFGSRWTHIDAPRHVTLIPSKLLITFALKHGLRVLDVSSSGAIARGYNSFGWAFSMKNLFENAYLGKIAHLSGRILCKLFAPIERSGMLGSTYTAVFRKERM